MPNAGPNAEPRVFDKTIVTLLAVGFAAIALTGLVVNLTPNNASVAKSQQGAVRVATASSTASNRDANVVWATTAPGRVEPKGGKIRLRPEATGRIVKVHTAAGSEVRKGDVLAQLRDDEAFARLIQARSEVAVRLGERDEDTEEPETNELVLARRKATDELDTAERGLFEAWRKFDDALIQHRAGQASAADVKTAREAIKTAKDDVAAKASAVKIASAKPDVPLPTRLDSGLTLARADLRLAEIAFDNTRVRAPIDGMVLRFDGRVGEMASPEQRTPIAEFGDMTAVQITAEVQERDVSKVRVGQNVVVRSNAFSDADFAGKVIEVAPAVGAPGLRAQGPRQQIDAEILEVKIELDGKPPVMPGMRVDVFFKAEQRVSAAARK